MKVFPRILAIVALITLELGTGSALHAQNTKSHPSGRDKDDLSLLAVVAAAAHAKPVYDWVANDGRVIQAVFVRLDGETVIIERNGKQFPVALAKLHLDSVELAKKLSREAAAMRDAAKIPAAPAAALVFSLIPGGEFIMGDVSDGGRFARPHKVIVSPFYLQKTEVTKAQWDAVRAWGLKNGYPDLSEGGGTAPNHPVQTVSWYDVVKWCNARSEMDSITPCYYTNPAQTAIYRTGNNDLTSKMVKWLANGYRLPTETEWEKAARGGLSGKRFPWGDTISHEEANFRNSGDEAYQKGGTGYHPTYKPDGGIITIVGIPPTAPVGSFAATGYGLYDMAGNVMEWCWDLHGKYPSALETDPRGVVSSVSRVLRGGGYGGPACFVCVANRCNQYPRFMGDEVGFRLAQSQSAQQAAGQ